MKKLGNEEKKKRNIVIREKIVYTGRKVKNKH